MRADTTYRFLVRKVVDGHFMLFSWNGWVSRLHDASWLSSQQAQKIQALYGGVII